MCWHLTWPCVLAGDVRLWRQRRGLQNAPNAAAAHRRIPSVLPRRRGLGDAVDGGVDADAHRPTGIAEQVRSAELAYPRDAVRLCYGYCRWFPADRDPQLDRPRAGCGN